MIAVTGHLERGKVRGIAKRLVSMLGKAGFETELFGIELRKLNAKGFDLICVVGGDGSLLRVVRELRKPVPILGIAAGNRSYLMQVRPSQIGKAVRKITEGKFGVEKRTRLKGKVDGKRLPNALNEFLVVPKKSGVLINCIVAAGRARKKIASDGIIIATPTGSSGHAYSAGGKKLKHGEKKFVIVPSNPLNRAGKAFTVSDKKKITVKCIGRETALEVVVDGRARFPLEKKLVAERGEPTLLLRVKGLQ